MAAAITVAILTFSLHDPVLVSSKIAPHQRRTNDEAARQIFPGTADFGHRVYPTRLRPTAGWQLR